MYFTIYDLVFLLWSKLQYNHSTINFVYSAIIFQIIFFFCVFFQIIYSKQNSFFFIHKIILCNQILCGQNSEYKLYPLITY